MTSRKQDTHGSSPKSLNDKASYDDEDCHDRDSDAKGKRIVVEPSFAGDVRKVAQNTTKRQLDI